ncbi:MAG: undecaprenyl-phosphate glucose phosphotransferase [Pseudomonadota bacterium]
MNASAGELSSRSSVMGRGQHIPVKRLFHYHDTFTVRAQMIACMCSSALVLIFFAYLRDSYVGVSYRLLAVLSAMCIFGVYSLHGVFRRSDWWRNTVVRMARAWAMVVAVVLFAGFATKSLEEFSRLVLGGWIVAGFIVQVVCYLAIDVLNRRFYGAVREPLRALVVGSGPLANHLVKSINGNRWLPDSVVGIVDNSARGRGQWDESLCSVMGRTSDIEAIVTNNRIRRVYVAVPLQDSDMLSDLHHTLVESNIDVIWAPDIFSLPLLNHGSREVAGVPLLALSESPMAAESRLLAKSAIDIAVSSLMLLALAPLMIGTAVAVKLSSPGPVLFRQKRHGWDGRIIEIWKFRSMQVHEENGNKLTQASRQDTRVTRVGRFIRRTSIDELPQLFNVLTGSMSLVGPRPHAVEHNEYYSQRIGTYMARHRLKPGLTGLAQIKGYRGETAELTLMEQRVKYDLKYINTWSIWLDLEILLKTPRSLFSSNIY